MNLTPPKFLLDPDATRELAQYTAKLQDILQFIIDNLQTIEVVTTAPVVTQMEERGDEAGKLKSDVIIEHSATQSNRALWYRYQGTVYKIDSA